MKLYRRQEIIKRARPPILETRPIPTRRKDINTKTQTVKMNARKVTEKTQNLKRQRRGQVRKGVA